MAEKKMTRVEALELALETLDNAEAREIVEKMIAQLSKPRKRAEGPSKARLNNERLAHEVAEAIAAKGEPVSSKWIAEHVRGILTPQKVTAVAKVGAELGLIVKIVEGRNVTYTVAE